MKAKSLKVKLKSIEELNAASPEQPKFLRAVVQSQARNPQWVFASIDGVEGKCVVAIPRRFTGKLEGKVISYKSLLIEWCQKEKKTFHYDVYEDNEITGERLFGVKLSIDGKVVAKARATSKKKAEEKASQRGYFAFQEKIDKK